MKNNLIYFPDVWQDSMEDLVNQYTVEELRQIVKLHEIPGAHKYRKSELVSCIVKSILEKEYMKKYFMLASNEELELFEQILDAELEGMEEETLMFGYFFQGGYAFVDDQGEVFVPEEVRTAYEQICTSQFYREHALFETAYIYCIGMVNIFGAVSLDMITECYNKYEQEPMTKDQIFSDIFVPSLTRFRNLRYSDGMLVESFLLQEKDLLSDVLRGRETFECYVPTRRDIWQAAKFVEEPLMAFGTYLMDELELPVQKALGLSELVSHMLKIGTMPEEVFQLIQKDDITFLGKDQANRFFEELKELWLDTRLYTTYGHTPREI